MSEELIAENARLAARVDELEAQLAAKPPIDRASLYRATSHAPWAVIAINAERRLDYANPAAQRWLTQAAPAAGARMEDALVPALHRLLEDPFAAAVGGQEHQAHAQLRDAAGEVRELRLVITPRGGGPQGITGAIVSLYDETETQALDRAVRENEARLAQVGAVTPNVNYIWDYEAGIPIWATGRTDTVYGRTAEELIAGGRALSLLLIHPDDLPKIGRRVKELAARPDGHVAEFELRIRRSDGGYGWILDRAVVFERDASGRILKTLSTAIDIDDRKRSEERRMLLINELNHRVKNTLAAVQSIARQTLRAGRPTEQAMELFTARLVALSAAHNLLTRENWEGAALREVIAGALEPFSQRGDGRLDISGPDVRLGARPALALAMALHELATNAAKYGALSLESGRVELAWGVETDGGRKRLVLEWRERDGPPVRARRRSGFGSRLLTQGLPSELDGTAELDFRQEGVVCRITAPLETPSAPQPAEAARETA